LESLPAEPPALAESDTTTRRRLRKKPVQAESATETVLVGANLPPSYARNLAFLHAETGRSKKELLQEALDLFFTSKGGAHLNAQTTKK
ncbi:hypothetical protein M0654_22395, partial [Rhizobium sp. NTR19]